MSSTLRTFAVAALTVTALTLAGCESMKHKDHHDHDTSASKDMSSAKVVCDQCNDTWEQKMVVNDKGVAVPQVFTAKGADVCPTCKKAAEDYFATGTSARCQTCGGKMKVVAATK